MICTLSPHIKDTIGDSLRMPIIEFYKYKKDWLEQNTKQVLNRCPTERINPLW